MGARFYLRIATLPPILFHWPSARLFRGVGSTILERPSLSVEEVTKKLDDFLGTYIFRKFTYLLGGPQC